jgi:hypothetical protein
MEGASGLRTAIFLGLTSSVLGSLRASTPASYRASIASDLTAAGRVRLRVEATVQQYGGLIWAIDALQPEGYGTFFLNNLAEAVLDYDDQLPSNMRQDLGGLPGVPEQPPDTPLSRTIRFSHQRQLEMPIAEDIQTYAIVDNLLPPEPSRCAEEAAETSTTKGDSLGSRP